MTTSRARPSVRAVLTLALLVGACGDGDAVERDAGAADAGAGDAELAGESLRGARYCEVLVVFVEAGAVEVQVWGTQGLSQCPAAAWQALDAESLRSELGAVRIVMNGPRHWLIDEAQAEMLPDVPTRMFGDLELRQLATVQLDLSMLAEMQPYVERIVNRTTRFAFRKGAEIYELVSPDGAVYAMQSYAQIVDTTLTEADLAELGARLQLPDGFQYRVRVLDADLDVRATGQAVVLQDELQNTYQRYVP